MFASKYIHALLFFAVVSLTMVACDSNSDDDNGEEPPADAELFIGNWSLVSAADQDGARDQTDVFVSVGVLTITFNDDDTFSLLLNYIDPDRMDLNLPGTYSIDEDNNQLTLTATLIGDLNFTYLFNDDDNVELTGNLDPIELLLGTDLEGNVVVNLQKAM